MTSDKFDNLIKEGKDIQALRLFAKEYYESAKMGHTRKLLIERIADKYEILERKLVELTLECERLKGVKNE